MANSAGSASSKINFFYETTCHYDEDEIPAAAASGTPSSSASVVFKVQSILRLSVAGGNHMNEFLEEKDWTKSKKSHPELPWSRNRTIIDENHWRDTRQSCLELPCSTDGLIIIDDDYSDLKIPETLTALRVPKVSHQSIIDTLRIGAASISRYAGLDRKVVVEIREVTHITIPVVDEKGKAISPEGGDHEDEDYWLQTEEEELDQAQFVDYLRKNLIFGTGDNNNEEDEEALERDWFWKLLTGIDNIGWQITEEEEEKKKGAEEAKERDCPICMETITLEGDDKEAWRKMPCCSKVFHRDCISMWTAERAKKCPWCRSSFPLLLQSTKGFLERLYSNRMYCPSHPGELPEHFVQLWHLLAERIWWSDVVVHQEGCKCGCYTTPFHVIRA